ncbi:hypothetical protein V6N13_073037 [Hibiscus sabdariffa]
MSEALLAEFKPEDVFNVVKFMGPMKAAGEDGLGAVFNQHDSLILGEASVNEACTLKNIFQEYASSSGQVIYFDKSGLFFSSSAVEQARDDVKRILRVDSTLNMEKYLGLPPMMGREKKRAFLSWRDKMKCRT